MLLNINVCTDVGILKMNPESVVVCIGDCNNDVVKYMNAIPASLYNPPFDAITSNLDGDINRFIEIYFGYLTNNEDVRDFSIALIRTALMGKSILLYLTPNEYELYFNVLGDYFAKIFGLIVGNPMLGIQCCMNEDMCQNMIAYLYITDDMPYDVFLRLYYKPINQDIANKLLIDTNLSHQLLPLNCNIEQYNRIFNDMKKNICTNVHRPRIYRNYSVNDNVQ